MVVLVSALSLIWLSAEEADARDPSSINVAHCLHSLSSYTAMWDLASSSAWILPCQPGWLIIHTAEKMQLCIQDKPSVVTHRSSLVFQIQKTDVSLPHVGSTLFFLDQRAQVAERGYFQAQPERFC